jgi:hypothetical protein
MTDSPTARRDARRGHRGDRDDDHHRGEGQDEQDQDLRCAPPPRGSRARSHHSTPAGSLCTAAHSLHTGIGNIFGTSISETTMRPDPTRQPRPPTARACPSPSPCRRYPMPLTSLESQVSELVNSDTCPRPTTNVRSHGGRLCRPHRVRVARAACEGPGEGWCRPRVCDLCRFKTADVAAMHAREGRAIHGRIRRVVSAVESVESAFLKLLGPPHPKAGYSYLGH